MPPHGSPGRDRAWARTRISSGTAGIVMHCTTQDSLLLLSPPLFSLDPTQVNPSVISVQLCYMADIPIQKSRKQGCPASPMLFALPLEPRAQSIQYIKMWLPHISKSNKLNKQFLGMQMAYCSTSQTLRNPSSQSCLFSQHLPHSAWLQDQLV